MPTLNQRFPAPDGLDHPLVTGLLMLCALTTLSASVLPLVGLLRLEPNLA